MSWLTDAKAMQVILYCREKYREDFKHDEYEPVPTMSGLAVFIDVPSYKIEGWFKKFDYDQGTELECNVFDALHMMLDKEETKIVNGMLSGAHNAQAGKFVAINHFGSKYSDKSKLETENKTEVKVESASDKLAAIFDEFGVSFGKENREE
jgi:hypothetical protein